MVKKVKKAADSQPSAQAPSAGPGLLDSQFGQLVKESAQQIWSAGLAAFAKAQNSSGKAFDSLAAEGERLQKKTQASTEERLGAVASRMSDMAGEVGTRAGQHWDKLESIFEDRVARALQRLGVPTAKDLAALQQQLDALTKVIQAQGGGVPDTAGKKQKGAVGPSARDTHVAASKAARGRAVKTAAPATSAKVAAKPRATPSARGKAKAAGKVATKAATRASTKASTKAATKPAPKSTAKPATQLAARKSAPATRGKR